MADHNPAHIVETAEILAVSEALRARKGSVVSATSDHDVSDRRSLFRAGIDVVDNRGSTHRRK